jgi:hypothetical protein
MYGYGEYFTPPVRNSYSESLSNVNQPVFYESPSIASFPISPMACECECDCSENSALIYVLICLASIKLVCVAMILAKVYIKDTPVVDSTVSEFPSFEEQTLNPIYTGDDESTVRTHPGMEQLRNRQHSASTSGTEWDYPAR